MRFRIANPRRKLRRRRNAGKACHRAGVRLAHCKYPRSSWHLGRKKMKKTYRRRAASRRGRKARRSVKRSSYRSVYSQLRARGRRSARRAMRRRSNPVLAVGNPRRSYRRRRNPPLRMGNFLNIDTIKEVFIGVGGFAVARIVRDKVSTFYPTNLSATMEGVLNVGVKIGTAVLGGYLVSKWNKRAGKAFATGALFSAAWDVVALVTNKPMALSEYVAPRALARGRGLRLGCVGAGCGGMGAYAATTRGAPSWANR